ncbi:MAG: TetR/AcrR family transcriptional regulator [Gammaproteobacteria bacterium]|nr:TetR/AcrR family transcriptional regulator [Gammaproteobacteria bacterium]
MKTSERILMVSLTLFNTHGEPNVSSVDIANELDISPGNLYYHFKGKDSIISSLFEMYRQRMSKILLAPNKENLSLEEFFYYLLMILETSNLFIFLYRNPTELSEKYPQVARGLARILSTKKKVFQQCIQSFANQQQLKGDRMQQQQMVELIGLVCTQSPNYHLMLGEDITEGNYVYDSLAIILFALAPYMNIDKEVYQELYHSIISQQLKTE